MPQIRNEEKRDHQAVEELTRRAFYNLYVPGCVEHYLVHIMREHEDFIPELDFVLEEDGRIIGNIMYTKAKLVDETGREKEILTFGPVCVEPDLQRQGYGKQLMEHSFTKAVELATTPSSSLAAPQTMSPAGSKAVKNFRFMWRAGSIPRPCW